MSKRPLRTACALIAALAFAGQAYGAVFTESTDVGNLTGSAEVLGGNVIEIDGTLFNDPPAAGTADQWDIDLYRITIAAPTLFFARTSTPTAVPFVEDPVLFLFDSLGVGVAMNDDESSSSVQSLLTGVSITLAAGDYFLGIGWAFSNPLDFLGLSLFPDFFDTFNCSLTDTCAGDPTRVLDSWDTSLTSRMPATDVVESFAYQIDLRTVPEPGSLALLAAAGLLAGVARRRPSDRG